jgi:hypothetical protein
MSVTDAYRSARPAIAMGGNDDPILSDRLLSLVIVENVEGLYRCEALFGNWGNKNGELGFLSFDRRQFEFGKSLRIKYGQDVLFEGRISALEGKFPRGSAPQIGVLAEDRMQDLRMKRRTRSFENATDADVFRKIAGEHGLSANVTVPGPKHRLLAQINQSDLAFLRERARTLAAELWIEQGVLRVETRTNRQGALHRMTYGLELREFSVLADLAHQRTSAAVCGWDVGSKSRLKFEANDSLLSGELNGDSSGASILKSAFGERKESLVHTVPLGSADSQAEAESYFRLTGRRFVVGRGLAGCDGRLRVGRQVELLGLGPLFSGKYYLSEVRHQLLGPSGFETEFTAERPGLGRPS